MGNRQTAAWSKLPPCPVPAWHFDIIKDKNQFMIMRLGTKNIYIYDIISNEWIGTEGIRYPFDTNFGERFMLKNSPGYRSIPSNDALYFAACKLKIPRKFLSVNLHHTTFEKNTDIINNDKDTTHFIISNKIHSFQTTEKTISVNPPKIIYRTDMVKYIKYKKMLMVFGGTYAHKHRAGTQNRYNTSFTYDFASQKWSLLS
eukprot:269058_1